MPNSTTMTGSEWFTCDQCGFDYPVEFMRRQRGLRFCTYLPCYDRPGGQETASDDRIIFPRDRTPEKS